MMVHLNVAFHFYSIICNNNIQCFLKNNRCEQLPDSYNCHKLLPDSYIIIIFIIIIIIIINYNNIINITIIIIIIIFTTIITTTSIVIINGLFQLGLLQIVQKIQSIK